ncbi:MAG: CDGSH iron-sulfur domain-containing protein, partial [Steroidobacteraceae bacterium]
LKTALAAFDAIVLQGEGAPAHADGSHFQTFTGIREELRALQGANASFVPAFPAATNPVLRRPPKPEGRVWIEDSIAIATVDLANASYGLMLRLLAYAYAIPTGHRAKSVSLDLAIGLMKAFAPLSEQAARLPAGPSNPECHAGASFTTLRDAASWPPGHAAEAFFVDRLEELAAAAEVLAVNKVPRCVYAAEQLTRLARSGRERLSIAPRPNAVVTSAASASTVPALPKGTPAPTDTIEVVPSPEIEIRFQARRCIHSRFCVTGAPKVFLANVQGPWIHPEAMPVERLVEVAQACPSGAIQYSRRDGQLNESAPPVNLATIREAGPYAFRGDLKIDGANAGFRVTLCRCGASKNKPYCDSSHHDIGFTATGEPASSKTDMLPVRDGPLAIDPQPNGPLQVRGNLEITSGTGRVVARVETAYLCRCGGSQTKPFCDGTHAKIGFRS